MGAPRLAKRLIAPGTFALVLALPLLVEGQGTPLPVPTGPGGGSAPIYVQPPSSGVRTGPPATETPEPSSSPSPVPPTARPSAEVESGKAAPAKSTTRQLTSFPELTRGVGNSETLLEK
jgi:hypothetical protein